MSNYVKVTDFATKDALPSGDPNKKVRGTELDAEFEAIEAAVATKADLSSPTFTGTPSAPTAAASDDTTKIATTAHVKDAVALAFVGMIVMWSGSVGSIPAGWALCDGTNGTPDLRGKFVIGAGGGFAVAANGGSFSATTSSNGSHSHGGLVGGTTLTTDQIPAHTHSAGFQAGYTADGLVGASAYSGVLGADTGSTGGSQPHNHTIGTDGAHTHTSDFIPPYYALCFIMKTA